MGPAPIFKPEGFIRVSPDAKFMVSQSVFQKDFRSHSALQGLNRLEHSRSVDHLGGKAMGRFEDMTSYKRCFGRDRPPQHPGLPKSQSVDVLKASKARQAAAF